MKQMDEQDDDRDQRQAMLNRAAVMLGEHFDSVLILTTRRNEGKDNQTTWHQAQSGNGYASYGLAKAYISRHDEHERILARSSHEDDEL